MATWRFYRAPQVGTGTRIDPFRSKVLDIVRAEGDSGIVGGLPHPARDIFYTFTFVEPATHTVIAADAEITVLSPQLDDEAAVDAWELGDLTSVPLAIRQAIDDDGIPVADFTTSNTRRQLIRRIADTFSFLRAAKGQKQQDIILFLGNNLDMQLNAIPIAQRNAIQNWLENRGADLSGLTGTDTVRDLFITVRQQLDFGRIVFGPFG